MTHCCLADMSGPFYALDKPFRNWSSLPFYQLDLPHAPYVDAAQLAAGVQRAVAYLAQIHAQGYTGIVIDNLAHLVTFADAPVPLYPPDSPFARRALRYRAAFGALFDAAAQRGMAVFVTSDMQWSTPPIRAYVGALTADNPRLKDVNRWALAELFATFPQVGGVVVRTGEAGGAHNQGGDYAGHMLYTTVETLRGLVGTLLPVCERHNRQLIMRTWSLGIGETGDLLWSPERYRAVFGGFRSPHLLVSIKHGPSDFFRHLPHNPTLGLPGPQQIIEVQNRREYELFGMVPSSVAALHQAVTQRAATNGRYAGVWAWNATGGWGGGRAALGELGWNNWTMLSSALTAALVGDPDLDTDMFIGDWCARAFGGDFGAAVADLYRASAALIERGWYQGPLDHHAPTLGGLHLPALLWVWWTRPTAAPLIWAYIAAAVRDHAAVVAEGAAALARAAWHAERLQRSAPADDERAAKLVTSARYLRDALAVAQATRALLLPLYAAAFAGDRRRWHALARQAEPVRAALVQHRQSWGADADFPALELDELEGFVRRLIHAPDAAWLTARAACVLVARVRAGRLPGRLTYAAGVGAALTLALVSRSPTIGALGVLSALLAAPPLRQRLIGALLPRLNARINLLPTIFFETGPSLSEWTA